MHSDTGLPQTTHSTKNTRSPYILQHGEDVDAHDVLLLGCLPETGQQGQDGAGARVNKGEFRLYMWRVGRGRGGGGAWGGGEQHI